ncbi:MAG TPA: glycosyl hydrolase family 43 [Actinomycetota bacterium]|nr:glycosyl hydrolase family 43 [Actinomycetota bacterium]
MRLADLTPRQVADLRWTVRPDPVLRAPMPSPVIADPSFLPPDDTPQRDWRLWAHSLLGLHAFRSDDGLAWERVGTVARNALRAHIVDTGGEPHYWLGYERTRLFVPIGLPWKSWIEARRGDDLVHWGSPRTLLRPSLPWHISGRDQAVSNPCLVAEPNGGWRLYYSAGLTALTDCGFPEPTYIGVATGPTPVGPFEPMPAPLLGPGDGPASLCAGAIKVLRVTGGWVGFQNAITWDGTHSGSEIWVLGSSDGLGWEVLGDRPLLAPTGRGWMATHVYALDVRDTPLGPRLYFNARDRYHWTRGRERIGVATPA